MIKYPPYVNIHTHKKGGNEISINCVGVHPYDVSDHAKLSKEAVTEQINAIGEIGLDFSISVERKLQKRVFREQLSLAQEMELPVVIHSVRALDDTINILKEYTLRSVILHGFIGSKQQSQNALNQGYYLSFGHRCFHSPKSLEALGCAPLSQIFFETDDQDIDIETIYKMGGEYRQEGIETIKEQLYNNYLNIFKKQWIG